MDFSEEKEVFSPQDLTMHYKQEIPYCVIDGVFVAAHYRDIQDILEAYKYRSEREKSKQLVQFLHILVLSRRKYLPWETIVITPVPMHWSRYFIRGFDHVSMIGEQLAKKVKIPFQKLLKANYTKRQSKLHKSERVKNREHAFSFRWAEWAIPDTVILIDDVISTGSTINACAKILKDAGVKNVYGCFIASNQ